MVDDDVLKSYNYAKGGLRLKKSRNIAYVVNENDDLYYKNLKIIKLEVKKKLKTMNYLLKNSDSGYLAKINSITIGKALYPKPAFNPYARNYINNLMALFNLNKLFEEAIYVDMVKPMKKKVSNQNIIGFHHFVVPFILNKKRYRVFLTAQEKRSTKVLVLLTVKIEKMPFYLTDCLRLKKQTNLKKLSKNIKIYDYIQKDYLTYNIDNIKSSNKYIKEDYCEYVGYVK